MNQRITYFMLAALFLVSCTIERPEGDWDPMEWEATTYQSETHNQITYYNVPDEGATFSFSCKNYSSYWIENIRIDEGSSQRYLNRFLDSVLLEDDYFHLGDETIQADVEKNVLNVKFPPSDGTTRTFFVTVTGGDIFYTFGFKR